MPTQGETGNTPGAGSSHFLVESLDSLPKVATPQGSGMRGATPPSPARINQGERVHAATQVPRCRACSHRGARGPDASVYLPPSQAGGPTRLRGPPALRRHGEPLPAPPRQATGSEPDSTSPPGSPPPAHTCRRVTPRAARARPPAPPFGAPLPCARDVARVPPRPGVKPTARPPPRSASSTPPPPPPPGPARAPAPPPALSPPRALTREDTHTLRLSLTGRPAPRAPAGVLAHPAAPLGLGGARGRGRAAVAVGPHSPPSRAGSECAAFRCEAMRCDARGPRFSAGYGGDVVGGLRGCGGVTPSLFTSQKHGDPRN